MIVRGRFCGGQWSRMEQFRTPKRDVTGKKTLNLDKCLWFHHMSLTSHRFSRSMNLH